MWYKYTFITFNPSENRLISLLCFAYLFLFFFFKNLFALKRWEYTATQLCSEFFFFPAPHILVVAKAVLQRAAVQHTTAANGSQTSWKEPVWGRQSCVVLVLIYFNILFNNILARWKLCVPQCCKQNGRLFAVGSVRLMVVMKHFWRAKEKIILVNWRKLWLWDTQWPQN